MELAKEGFTYFYKDSVMISIYRLYKVTWESAIKTLPFSRSFQVGIRYDLTTIYNVDSSDSWVVEVSSIPVKLDEVSQVTEDIKDVQSYLHGLIHLEYVDHLILENKITYPALDH